MNVYVSIFGSLFFRHRAPVYALCAMTALPAIAQNSGAPGNAGEAGKPDDTRQVTNSDDGTVELSAQDTDLATVLQMLSIEHKKNIITSKTVSAKVTANLYGVTFHEALKAILDVNGYTYYEEGNFIYVITKEEAQELEKARRVTQSRIFPLNYLSATDANEFILPLLSDDGKASARGTVQPGIKPEVTNAGADDYAYSPRVVVNDYAANLDAIAALLAELDTPPHQVLVEATILQTAMNEDNAFGVDFTVLGSLNFTDLTSPLSAVNNLLAGDDPVNGFQPPDNTGRAISTNVGNTAGAGGIKVGIVSDDISVFLRVLDEVTDTTVLARPKIMALNRQRAEVHVGTKVGYLSTTATETTTTQNVQFLDTGVQLIFRPFISSDGMIRLELKPSVSDFRLRDVTDSTGNPVTIPDELTNQVITNVRIRDGQTLVLGGLFRERAQTTRRQVPLLGDIPVVGAAFRGQEDNVTRAEIIFLITPSIVHDSTLWTMGEDQMTAVDLLRVGARAELLPFSREKVTANYNQKAQDAFNRGDFDKALYFVNNSLGLSPNQPEMIRLREQITGERARAHERSLMERTFRKGLGMAPAPAQDAPAPEANKSTEQSPTTATVSAPPVEAAVENTPTDEAATAQATESESSQSPPADGSAVADAEGASSESAPAAPETSVTADASPETSFVPESQSQTSATTTTDSMTPQQQAFYEQILYEYFTALKMTETAAFFSTSQQEDALASHDESATAHFHVFPIFPSWKNHRVKSDHAIVGVTESTHIESSSPQN